MFSPCTDGCVLLQSRVHFVVQEELRLPKQSASKGKSACVEFELRQMYDKFVGSRGVLHDRISHYN